MPDIKLDMCGEVSTLQKDFLKEFGLTLRVYNGRSFAEPNQSLGQVRKRARLLEHWGLRTVSVTKNITIGNLEDKFEKEIGIKVRVSASDGSYLCDKILTLKVAQHEDKKKIGEWTMAGSKEFDVIFAKGSVSRECVWKKIKGGSEDSVKVEVYWKWYGGTLVVEDGEDFDIETVSLNKNSEWKKYKFVENVDFSDIEVFVESEHGEYEDVLNEEDQDAMEEKLSEDGYELISDQMVFDEGKLEITEV